MSTEQLQQQNLCDQDFVLHVALPHFEGAATPAPIIEMIDFALSGYAPVNELEYE